MLLRCNAYLIRSVCDLPLVEIAVVKIILLRNPGSKRATNDTKLLSGYKTVCKTNTLGRYGEKIPLQEPFLRAPEGPREAVPS